MLDMFKVYHRAHQSMAFERRFDDAPTESVPDVQMHESSIHRFLQTFEPRGTCDQ